MTSGGCSKTLRDSSNIVSVRTSDFQLMGKYAYPNIIFLKPTEHGVKRKIAVPDDRGVLFSCSCAVKNRYRRLDENFDESLHAGLKHRTLVVCQMILMFDRRTYTPYSPYTHGDYLPHAITVFLARRHAASRFRVYISDTEVSDLSTIDERSMTSFVHRTMANFKDFGLLETGLFLPSLQLNAVRINYFKASCYIGLCMNVLLLASIDRQTNGQDAINEIGLQLAKIESTKTPDQVLFEIFLHGNGSAAKLLAPRGSESDSESDSESGSKRPRLLDSA